MVQASLVSVGGVLDASALRDTASEIYSRFVAQLPTAPYNCCVTTVSIIEPILKQGSGVRLQTWVD
jgi:hypothetical protein